MLKKLNCVKIINTKFKTSKLENTLIKIRYKLLQKWLFITTKSKTVHILFS